MGTRVLTLLMTGIPGQKDKWLKNSVSPMPCPALPVPHSSSLHPLSSPQPRTTLSALCEMSVQSAAGSQPIVMELSSQLKTTETFVECTCYFFSFVLFFLFSFCDLFSRGPHQRQKTLLCLYGKTLTLIDMPVDGLS